MYKLRKKGVRDCPVRNSSNYDFLFYGLAWNALSSLARGIFFFLRVTIQTGIYTPQVMYPEKTRRCTGFAVGSCPPLFERDSLSSWMETNSRLLFIQSADLRPFWWHQAGPGSCRDRALSVDSDLNLLQVLWLEKTRALPSTLNPHWFQILPSHNNHLKCGSHSPNPNKFSPWQEAYLARGLAESCFSAWCCSRKAR